MQANGSSPSIPWGTLQNALSTWGRTRTSSAMEGWLSVVNISFHSYETARYRRLPLSDYYDRCQGRTPLLYMQMMTTTTSLSVLSSDDLLNYPKSTVLLLAQAGPGRQPN